MPKIDQSNVLVIFCRHFCRSNGILAWLEVALGPPPMKLLALAPAGTLSSSWVGGVKTVQPFTHQRAHREFLLQAGQLVTRLTHLGPLDRTEPVGRLTSLQEPDCLSPAPLPGPLPLAPVWSRQSFHLAEPETNHTNWAVNDTIDPLVGGNCWALTHWSHHITTLLRVSWWKAQGGLFGKAWRGGTPNLQFLMFHLADTFWLCYVQ